MKKSETPIIHTNFWHWGRKDTIIIAGGRAMCELSVEYENPNVAYLSDLIVYVSSRGRGLGRQLLQLATERAKRIGAKRIVLWSDVDDWPIEWYKRNGFVEYQRHSDNGLAMLQKILWPE